ncbi:hypothetical protein CEUSTIGMA_g7297.t1 [Chlamydomonas eustigma]|uniref:BFN domain-containing protein n=1 Tax=Chlamydomonas eustigma TaxID=1157962 RepID=A0A250X9W4_9CHLO|nr:hypothetical protein CEUSTIGMA_g7297.t1 [Chlamydomonas eustigma]|eukprot:GAX79857.1 hypothetical protein CEUSTIGMA_g7297.t1 [Chlamydomonas eustigma]
MSLIASAPPLNLSFCPQVPLKPVISVRHRSSSTFSCNFQLFGTPPVNSNRRNFINSPRERTGLNHIVARASKDDELSEHIEVKVDSVRVTNGAAVIFLRLCDSAPGLVLPVHIGEAESSALLKEINKQKGFRPLTHDLTKHLLQAAGFRVLKIRITELVNSTYYSRIHIAHIDGKGEIFNEVDVDSRPSDAINLAVRFDAPMYITKQVANYATSYPVEPLSQQSETNAEIVRSVRETLATFEDPTTMLQLQKELAIQEERYADAKSLQQQIFSHMTQSVMLRMVVAMEAALADNRFEEAARVRDEYKRAVEAERMTVDNSSLTSL